MVALAACVGITGTVVTGTGPHGGDERVARLPFIVEDVARIHSLTAWAFLAATIAFGWVLLRHGGTERAFRRLRWLVLLVVAQGALGYTQYVMGVPPRLVALHVAGSVAVWVATLVTYLGLFSYPAEVAEPVGNVTTAVG
jgi:cytochrome c oxidase assembly protein subunit 15